MHQALLLGTAPIDQPEFSWATPDPGGTFVDRLHTMAAALVEAVSIMLAEGASALCSVSQLERVEAQPQVPTTHGSYARKPQNLYRL